MPASDRAAAEVKKRYFAEELMVLVGDEKGVTMEVATSKGEWSVSPVPQE